MLDNVSSICGLVFNHDSIDDESVEYTDSFGYTSFINQSSSADVDEANQAISSSQKIVDNDISARSRWILDTPINNGECDNWVHLRNPKFEEVHISSYEKIEAWISDSQNEENTNMSMVHEGTLPTKIWSSEADENHSENTIIKHTAIELNSRKVTQSQIAKRKSKKQGKSKRCKSRFTKKSKSRYHYELNNQDLSQRKDVVNKTLLRSLKRYYTCVFNSDVGAYLKSKQPEIAQYLNNRKKPITTKSVKTLIEIIRSPPSVKDKLKTEYEVRMCEDFHGCLYKYSHTKLYQLLKLPQVQFIVKDYYENGLNIMASSDDTLKKNPTVYLDACKKFLDIINN